VGSLSNPHHAEMIDFAKVNSCELGGIFVTMVVLG
jgi:hypothetical protein